MSASSWNPAIQGYALNTTTNTGTVSIASGMYNSTSSIYMDGTNSNYVSGNWRPKRMKKEDRVLHRLLGECDWAYQIIQTPKSSNWVSREICRVCGKIRKSDSQIFVQANGSGGSGVVNVVGTRGSGGGGMP